MEPPIHRSHPEKKKHYQDYRKDLEKDFHNTCAYCFRMEKEFGIMTIDHYVPQSSPHGSKLVNDYENLLLACDDCNRKKGAYYHVDEELSDELRILRPDKDVPQEHYELTDSYQLKGKTITGTFNIAKLDLNSPVFVNIRNRREDLLVYREVILTGITMLSNLAFDTLTPPIKLELLRIKEELTRKNQGMEITFKSLLTEYARSPYKVYDPGKKARRKKAKERIRQLKQEHKKQSEETTDKSPKSE